MTEQVSKKFERYNQYLKECKVSSSLEIANSFYVGYGHGYADASEEIKDVKNTSIEVAEKNVDIEKLKALLVEAESTIEHYHNFDNGSPLYKKQPPLPIQLKITEALK